MSSATISLTGPSATPGAPQITPATVNTAVNAALLANFNAAAADVASETSSRGQADTAILAGLVNYAPLVGGVVPWANLPVSARQLPILFPIIGKPPSGQVYNRFFGMAITIPANFAGANFYATTANTSTCTIVVNRISSSNVVTQIGTLTINPGHNFTFVASTQAAASLAASEVLQLAFPNPQDATLADLCATIMAQRV